MSEPALNPCGECGRALVEVNQTASGEWLCLGCYGRRGTEGSNAPTSPLTAPSPVDVPVPVPSIEKEREDLDVLLDAYEAGQLEPVHVETQELPRWATPSYKQVLDKLALCSGLLLAKGDDGTVMFAVDWAADRFGFSGSTVSTALRRLRLCGAIRLVKVLPPPDPKNPDCKGPRVYAVVSGRPNLQLVDGGAE